MAFKGIGVLVGPLLFVGSVQADSWGFEASEMGI